ncbi:unnamed protein product [Allacma fusca]|uniref:Uncharacterized protein n=1 Tax=Allacma fusca TaxID=39272 RepID=A0A8J2KPZ3_9HEXA|nr:unnamed protein product [Allacma fusca]
MLTIKVVVPIALAFAIVCVNSGVRARDLTQDELQEGLLAVAENLVKFERKTKDEIKGLRTDVNQVEEFNEEIQKAIAEDAEESGEERRRRKRRHAL